MSLINNERGSMSLSRRHPSLRATGEAIQRKTAQDKILEWWQQIIE